MAATSAESGVKAGLAPAARYPVEVPGEPHRARACRCRLGLASAIVWIALAALVGPARAEHWDRPAETVVFRMTDAPAFSVVDPVVGFGEELHPQSAPPVSADVTNATSPDGPSPDQELGAARAGENLKVLFGLVVLLTGLLAWGK